MIAEINMEDLFLSATISLKRNAELDDLLDMERRYLLPCLRTFLAEVDDVFAGAGKEVLNALGQNQSFFMADIQLVSKQAPANSFIYPFTKVDYTFYVRNTDALHPLLRKIFPKVLSQGLPRAM